MIRFACGSCQKSISAPDEKAGMRFLCPGCKSPLEVPRGSTMVQAVRNPAAATGANPAIQRPPTDIVKAPFAKRFLGECLAIIGATFRQTLKPITLVFEIQRRRSLRKRAAQAKFALGQRALRIPGRRQEASRRISGPRRADSKHSRRERRCPSADCGAERTAESAGLAVPDGRLSPGSRCR